MDEKLSWQAKLAKSNINILNVDDERWYYEFMYHPHHGQTKWCKTFYELPVGEMVVPEEEPLHFYRKSVDTRPETIAAEIQRAVLKLRKELEG